MATAGRAPYTKTLTESRQDGMGLNTFDGSGTNAVHVLRREPAQAVRPPRAQRDRLPEPPVLLGRQRRAGHGHSRPGTSPSSASTTWPLAGSATGARTVFAYGEQLFVKSLKALFDHDDRLRHGRPLPHPPPAGHVGEYWGWVGADPRKFASVRTPGATEFLDPDPTKDGWYRAVTGDLTMTASEWKNGPDSPAAPNMGNLTASTDGGAQMGGQQGVTGSTPVFTPNGDGSTDTVTFNYTTNKETFVDWQVQNSGGTVVRSFSTWTQGGTGSATWDGKKNDGTVAPDGTYTLTGTPSSRAGNYGTPVSRHSQALDCDGRSRKASPNLFYAADGDSLAPTTTLSVNLTQAATFSWVLVDKNNIVVRTNMTNASVGSGTQTWQWDGKDGTGNYVPDGTYYSVMTAQTGAGTYTQRVAVDERAFSLTPATPAPFTRGTKVKFTVYSAEPLMSTTPKPKVKVTLPGLAAKVYSTTKLADGGFSVTVNVPVHGPGRALPRSM